MSHGCRSTSAAHWLKKLRIRMTLLTRAVVFGADEPLKDVVEAGNHRSDGFDHLSAVLERASDRRRRYRRILHDDP
jgi:hypothetical protein